MSIKLYYTDPNVQEQALALASIVPEALTLLIDESREVDEQLYLLLNKETLLLISPLFKPFDIGLFYSEFIAKRKPGLKREILLQAINLKSGLNENFDALDLTAGLGRDAILMALSGFSVTMLENNPYLAIILHYLCTSFKPQLKLAVHYISNDKYLQTTAKHYHVIYFDPMFADGKNSLAKKDMQLIDLMIRMVGDSSDVNNQTVFNLARRHCLYKLLVKRDNKQQSLVSSPNPTYVKSGKTIRFDVYQSSIEKICG